MKDLWCPCIYFCFVFFMTEPRPKNFDFRRLLPRFNNVCDLRKKKQSQYHALSTDFSITVIYFLGKRTYIALPSSRKEFIAVS